jgi:predicted nucleic acid-binding protein
MSDSHLILIDTCIWVPFFNRPASDEKRNVDALLDDGSAAIVGHVLYEVLVGFRRDEQADWVASALSGVTVLEPTRDEWRVAARLGRRLIGLGHRLPLTDVLMAALAVERHLPVYSVDPHFDLIPELLRYQPA